jgi:ABC-type uncharacterized transport system substrate-binding protein
MRSPWGTPGVRAAQQATTTIPIVITGAAYLVEQGIVASLAHPGGNITGVENNPLVQNQATFFGMTRCVSR